MGAWENIKKSLCMWGDLEVKGKIVGPNVLKVCDTVVPEQTFGQAPTAGISPNVSRCDHTHGTPPDNSSDKCICITGAYVGDGNDPQSIADIVPVDYIIQHAIVESTSPQEEADELVQRFEKNNVMEAMSPTFSHDLEGTELDPTTTVVDDDNTLTLNDPTRGIKVRDAANLFGAAYFFTVWASLNVPSPPLNKQIQFGVEPAGARTAGCKVNFDGTDYANGQQITAYIGGHPVSGTGAGGYSFTGWSVVGNVAVLANASPTTCGIFPGSSTPTRKLTATFGSA